MGKVSQCDPNAPLMVYTSRIVQEKDKRTDASKDKTVLARVLSGSMRAGRKIRVLDQDFFMGENECVYTDIVQFRDGKKRDVRTGDLVVLESSGQWKPVGATITGVEDIGASLLKPPRYLKFPNAQSTKDIDKKVGIIWDERFISGHIPYNNKNEIPDRTNKIMESLRVQGLLPRCKTMRPTNSATLDDVALVHTPEYINSVKDICAITDTEMRNDEAGAKFGDLYLSKKSFKTALLAAGAAIEVVEKVIKKELDSAFAIVRPPGHHAEANKGMGFCVFNNVAVAASVVLGRLPLNVKRILIVDWDIHHGNGTQETFLGNSNVLVFNVHRYRVGFFSRDGTGKGKGYNVNVPLEEDRYSDADYMAIWDHVLVPIATSFNPDLILISGGFDAAKGDPLGGCSVTPNGFSLMVKKLMGQQDGRIVITLEGGYSLSALPKCVCATVEALLQGKHIGELSSNDGSSIKISTWHLIQKVCLAFKKYWPTLIYNEEIADLKTCRR